MCTSVSITVQGFVSIISFCHLLLFAVSVNIFSCIDYCVHVAEELFIVQGHVHVPYSQKYWQELNWRLVPNLP